MKRRFLRFFLLCSIVCLLTSCAGASAPTSQNSKPGGSSTAQSNTPAQAATGTFHEYALPQSDSGLMRPAIDGQGRVWFGEMNRNYLGSFDPKTGQFWQQTPPMGKAGIMGLLVAPDNTIWFAEQYANYIGHFFPGTGKYHIYQLPVVRQTDPANTTQTESLPSAPNDLALDSQGNLWFSELNANKIGRLNTANGSIRQYPLPSPNAKSTQELDPYGIAIDPQGTVWFTEVSTNRLGRLNPLNSQVTYFTPPEGISSLMEVVSDAQGQIWATAFTSSILLHFNPTTSRFTVYNAPAPDNSNGGGLYDLTVASNGDIWVAITSEGLLANLNIHTQRFFYYTIPTPASLPVGLVEGKNQAIWFTESVGNKIGVLLPGQSLSPAPASPHRLARSIKGASFSATA